MFRRERRTEILELLDLYGRVEVDKLAERFGVGPDSIRKDLQALAKEGKCIRVYGGATSIPASDADSADSSPSASQGPDQSGAPAAPGSHTTGEKSGPSPSPAPTDHEDLGRIAVAQRAYLEIHSGDSIFLDISRTNSFLADFIARGDKQVIVTTNMIEVLQKLSNLDHVTALGTGGYLNVQLNGFVGDTTISLLEPLLFSKAFIGASGVDLDNAAVTSNNIDSGSVKERVIHNASYKFLLADSQKFEEKGMFRFASLNDFSAVITDTQDPVVLDKLRRLGIPTYRTL
ncbi:MAG: DeoR/GlpR family DNA-binding transcription regulator [Parafannyhessea sp.]|uniref:DeoR/GlpR family DNA-binding transcription regulator n=1 Tax=Parafannyhessea sp. TaxID=2847324 RepID=UPI003F003A0F